MVLGITGSSGAGKSTVCEILREKYNMKIIDADKIARELSKKGSRYIADIIEKFGNGIVDENGELRRKKLARIIYSDPAKREELNSCTFKYIKEEIEKQIKQTEGNKDIAIDAPLLFECGLDKICDKVIGVVSKKELQLDRIVARDNVDYEHANMRLDAQQDDEFYRKNCDLIIENEHDVEELKKQIEEKVTL